MHHVALDRAGPDDRHLDHEVVVALGPQARQHRHLRARLDLEHAHRVAVTDHLVDLRVLRRHGSERPARAAVTLDEIEAAPDRRQHPEAEHVHLEQAERVEVVLVPLDDGAVLHRRVLDRHQLVERSRARSRSRRRAATGAAGSRAGVRASASTRASTGLSGSSPASRTRSASMRGAVPPLHRPRQRLDLQRIETERLRHVTQRAARAVADHRGGERGAVRGRTSRRRTG